MSSTWGKKLSQRKILAKYDQILMKWYFFCCKQTRSIDEFVITFLVETFIVPGVLLSLYHTNWEPLNSTCRKIIMRYLHNRCCKFVYNLLLAWSTGPFWNCILHYRKSISIAQICLRLFFASQSRFCTYAFWIFNNQQYFSSRILLRFSITGISNLKSRFPCMP